MDPPSLVDDWCSWLIAVPLIVDSIMIASRVRVRKCVDKPIYRDRAICSFLEGIAYVTQRRASETPTHT
uniref:Transposase n=1 Tax=Ascaris lumbricoides TaxID=6252 RepID=A0A0M3I245_ASCLU